MTNSNVAIATTIAYSDDFGRLSVIYVDHQSSARIRCVCSSVEEADNDDDGSGGGGGGHGLSHIYMNWPGAQHPHVESEAQCAHVAFNDHLCLCCKKRFNCKGYVIITKCKM